LRTGLGHRSNRVLTRCESLPGSVRLLGLDEEECEEDTLISERGSVMFELGCSSVDEIEKEREARERLESDNLTSEILNTSQAILGAGGEGRAKDGGDGEFKRFIEDKLNLRIEAKAVEESVDGGVVATDGSSGGEKLEEATPVKKVKEYERLFLNKRQKGRNNNSSNTNC
jgi:hypothetical protein